MNTLVGEQREEQRTDIADHVTGQSTNWKRAKYPFDIMLVNYEVSRCVQSVQ